MPNCKCGHELWCHNTQGNGKCYGRNYKVISRKEDILSRISTSKD
jgi:hypothetical protein